MPKALELTDAALVAPPPEPPRAAQKQTVGTKGKLDTKAAPSEKTMPLQIRLPRPEVRAIKVAAAESEQTISDFLLSCFHTYMQARKHA
jgi:hypothetical protein